VDLQRRRILAAAATGAFAGAAPAARVLAQSAERVIRITARKFAFLPGEITLQKGIPVTLEFVAPEVVMGFSAPDFKVRADIVPGEVTRVRILPQQTGRFEFLCDIFCGDGHEGMHGTINVVA
jgi:cytochrome c oxidase subunit 2